MTYCRILVVDALGSLVNALTTEIPKTYVNSSVDKAPDLTQLVEMNR